MTFSKLCYWKANACQMRIKRLTCRTISSKTSFLYTRSLRETIFFHGIESEKNTSGVSNGTN